MKIYFANTNRFKDFDYVEKNKHLFDMNSSVVLFDSFENELQRGIKLSDVFGVDEDKLDAVLLNKMKHD